VKVETKRKKLEELPDSEKFNGIINATSIHYDINPILILEENIANTGPSLELAIDYYGPSAAARMGLPVDRVRYIVKSQGEFDHEYLEVWLPGLIEDDWGLLHAGDGEVTWGEIHHNQLESFLGEIGEIPTMNLGKTGIFVGDDKIIKRFTIYGYNGIQYVDDKGSYIPGELLRLERNNEFKHH
jgi:hypothetical protein